MQKPDLCEGCATCPLAEEWHDKWGKLGSGCAPPIGPTDAAVLVIGDSPGKASVQMGRSFGGSSGTMLRAALQQFGVDPLARARYVNVVQCRVPGKDGPEPIAQARCTVLADELRSFEGRLILTVGKVALDRLVGKEYTSLLHKSRSAWDGYVHPISTLVPRVSLGHEMVLSETLFKSGKRKGERKPEKRLIEGECPKPANAIGICACISPKAVMASGFGKVVQFKAAMQRAAHVAMGGAVLSVEELTDSRDSCEWPSDWVVPAEPIDLDLTYDIENSPEGVTYISFVEVLSLSSGLIGQQGSFPWNPATKALTQRLLGPDSPYKTLVAHNASYDCGQLLHFEGLHVRGSGMGERGLGLGDTMMAAQINKPDLPKALGAMWRYLPPMEPWKHLSGSSPRIYNLMDSIITAMVWVHLRKALKDNGQVRLAQTVMASVMVLDRMSRNGLPTDITRLNDWIDETEAEIVKQMAVWTELTGLDVLSGKRVAAWFFEKQECPVLGMTATGQYKFDESIMSRLISAHTTSDEAKKALGVLMGLKKLVKAVSTYGVGYAGKLDDMGYLHPSYLPSVKDGGDLGTAAGRLSSSPNVQNVPKGLRWIFKAPTGWVIGDSDLQAVEGRVQAVLAEDTELLEMYDRKGFDMHNHNLANAKVSLRAYWEKQLLTVKTAAPKKHAARQLELAEQGVWPIVRFNMKTFLYGWNYGSGDSTIAKGLSITLGEATAIREGYEKMRIATSSWRSAVVRNAATRKMLQNAFGRIRYFPGVVPEVHVRNQAINFFPQSTVADMFWVWYPLVEELLHEHGGWLITQVHDSFVWMLPQEQVCVFVPKLEALMSQEWPQIAPGFRVPSTHDVGYSWGSVKPFVAEDWKIA